LANFGLTTIKNEKERDLLYETMATVSTSLLQANQFTKD
jgi:hypothetical protein